VPMASLPASTAIAAARGYPDLHDHIDTLREAARVVTKRLRLAAQVMRANASMPIRHGAMLASCASIWRVPLLPAARSRRIEPHQMPCL